MKKIRDKEARVSCLVSDVSILNRLATPAYAIPVNTLHLPHIRATLHGKNSIQHQLLQRRQISVIASTK